MSRLVEGLVLAAAFVAGGSVAVVVRAYPGWRWEPVAWLGAFLVGGGLLVALAGFVLWLAYGTGAGRRVFGDAPVRRSGLDVAGVEAAIRHSACGDGWERHGLTVRQHLTGSVYSHDGRRTAVQR